ncbi:MAG: hypothetical protein KJZ80_06670 [Hyphomicrobiaceae bacterium]|nr:hypothetical protein [Hyphomicrobiaceae bacterium]
MDQAAKRGRRRLVLVQAGGCETGQEASERTSVPRQQLEYMADMIRQMQVMAWHAGCSTLAGILELAHREADMQRGGHGEPDWPD